MESKYQPSEKILENYADVLINFALNNGKGIKKGEVVFLAVPECAKPILIALRREVLKSGGHTLVGFSPDGFEREFYEIASDEQIKFFPHKTFKARVEQMDHSITIKAETNLHELKGISPKKIMAKNKALKPFKDWKTQKEAEGKFTWVLALYGTEAMAREAGMSLKDYWQQIIRACFLDDKNPIKRWSETFREVDRIKNKLNRMQIKNLRIKGEKTDLIVGIGKNRKWLGGSGRNIPSFEVFISPDCRITDGNVHFNQPLYRYGTLIKDIDVEFRGGKVVRIKASKGEDLIKEMVKVKGANMIGEFSLTDSRLSRITRFMADTLYDENIGGKYGNMHIAFGSAYKDSYPGDASTISKEKWDDMGYNDSAIHTDVISTENKEVTAYLESGEKKVIYKEGKFTV